MKTILNFVSSFFIRHSSFPKWSLPYDIEPLRRRLAGLDPADPLLPLLVGFLDASVVRLADTHVAGEGAHQLVGRLNMVADLRADLLRLWKESHP